MCSFRWKCLPKEITIGRTHTQKVHCKFCWCYSGTQTFHQYEPFHDYTTFIIFELCSKEITFDELENYLLILWIDRTLNENDLSMILILSHFFSKPWNWTHIRYRDPRNNLYDFCHAYLCGTFYTTTSLFDVHTTLSLCPLNIQQHAEQKKVSSDVH